MATTEKVIHEVTDTSLITSIYGGSLIAFKGKKVLSDKSFIRFYKDWGERVILNNTPSSEIQKLLDVGYTQIMHDSDDGVYYYSVNES